MNDPFDSHHDEYQPSLSLHPRLGDAVVHQKLLVHVEALAAGDI